jgi:hypothetical protein
MPSTPGLAQGGKLGRWRRADEADSPKVELPQPNLPACGGRLELAGKQLLTVFRPNPAFSYNISLNRRWFAVLVMKHLERDRRLGI